MFVVLTMPVEIIFIESFQIWVEGWRFLTQDPCFFVRCKSTWVKDSIYCLKLRRKQDEIPTSKLEETFHSSGPYFLSKCDFTSNGGHFVVPFPFFKFFIE
jgi:hypothetical protein